jgi:hypothetical protein
MIALLTARFPKADLLPYAVSNQDHSDCLIQHCVCLCCSFGDGTRRTKNCLRTVRIARPADGVDSGPGAAFANDPNYSANGVQVNAQGFRRAANLSLVQPANTVRIFLLGGSVAYRGALYPEIDEHWKFLENNQTIDHYLEARLNAAFPQKHWEVVNAAVKGYFLNQDLALSFPRSTATNATAWSCWMV